MLLLDFLTIGSFYIKWFNLYEKRGGAWEMGRDREELDEANQLRPCTALINQQEVP